MSAPQHISADAKPVLELSGLAGFTAPASRVKDLPGPKGLPLLGNVLQMNPSAMHATLEGWAQEFGPMFRFRLGPVEAVCVAEPGLINEMLRHRPRDFTRSTRLADLIHELGFTGVFSAEGDAWRRQRKLVMRALTPEAVKNFFPIISAVTQRLEARWQAAAERGESVNVTRDLKCYSIDVTTWLAMGVDVDTLNHDDNSLQSDVELWFATIGHRLPKLLPTWRYFKLPADRRVDEAMARLRATVMQLIEGARASLLADPALRLKPRNILEALVAARDEPGSEFTDEDVEGNVAVMLFAGEDTTANAMAWLLYFLSITPEVTANVMAECDQVLGDTSIVQAFGQFDQLDYLEAAAVESMRLKPIAPIQGMSAKSAMSLAGLALEPGQLLFLLQRAVATNAKYFDRATEFLPERWLANGGERADDTSRKTFPFGGGPRYCPGRYLAMVEIKIVIAMVLRNFQVSLEVDPSTIGEHYTFTMGPDSLPLRFKAR